VALLAGSRQERARAALGGVPSADRQVAIDQVAFREADPARVAPALGQICGCKHGRVGLLELSCVVQERGQVRITTRELGEIAAGFGKLYACSNVGESRLQIASWKEEAGRSERDVVLRAEIVSLERLGQAKTLLRTIDGSFLVAEE